MKLARHTSQPNFNSILYLPQLFDIIVTWLLTDRQECCRNKYQAACCCTRIVIECNNFQGRGPIRSNLRQYQQRMFFMKRKSMARVRESVLSDGEWSVCLMFFDMWCGSLRGGFKMRCRMSINCDSWRASISIFLKWWIRDSDIKTVFMRSSIFPWRWHTQRSGVFWQG